MSRCTPRIFTELFRHLPCRKGRVRVFHRPEDEVLHVFICPPIRNAGHEVGFTILINGYELAPSRCMGLIDIKLHLALILAAERRADELQF